MPNVGICLQAYLKRTYSGRRALLPLAPRIRLVKGAYAEPPTIAYQSRHEVDANYLALCVSMLREVKAGATLFLGLGTHDVTLIAQVADHARSIGLPQDDLRRRDALRHPRPTSSASSPRTASPFAS